MACFYEYIESQFLLNNRHYQALYNSHNRYNWSLIRKSCMSFPDAPKVWNIYLHWLVVSNIFCFHPYLRKIPILTTMFQRGYIVLAFWSLFHLLIYVHCMVYWPTFRWCLCRRYDIWLIFFRWGWNHQPVYHCSSGCSGGVGQYHACFVSACGVLQQSRQHSAAQRARTYECFPTHGTVSGTKPVAWLIRIGSFGYVVYLPGLFVFW